MIKKRKAKLSKRGIYLQDNELQQTAFKIGQPFKFMVDVQAKKMVIVPADDSTGNTVSKRTLKEHTKPVIDIRQKEALQAFQGAEFLQVEIYEHEIVVQGYVHQEQKGFITKIENLLDIRNLLSVKQTFDVRLSREQLEQVAGSYSDFSFNSATDYFNQKDLELALTVTSMFSGAGVFDSAFLSQGFDILFAIERDKAAAKTYTTNIGEHMYQGLIENIKNEDFNAIGSTVSIGGTPCQGLSQANRYQNFLDNPNNLLVKEYIRGVQANKKGKVFVIENSPRLLTAGNGKFRREIEAELSDYQITCDVLTASDYGDPQHRERAIMIGSKIGPIEMPKPSDFQMTVGEALQGLHEAIPNMQDYTISKGETLERMSYISQGGNWLDIPAELRTTSMTEGKTHSNRYRRLAFDEIAPALVNIRKAIFLHPVLNRVLSIRECARLFNVPDDFIFKGTLSDMQQQIANAVPVGLGSAIARTVKNAIINFNSIVKRKKFQLI